MSENVNPAGALGSWRESTKGGAKVLSFLTVWGHADISYDADSMRRLKRSIECLISLTGKVSSYSEMAKEARIVR